MSRRILALAVAIALLGGCSGEIDRTVQRSPGDVEAILQSADSDKALALAAHVPGAGHWIEPGAGRVVWHFTLEGKDYARMNVSLAENGPGTTRVTSAFEEVNDAAGQGLPYLREVAKAVGEETAAAAIEGRPVDQAALVNRYKLQVAGDPMKVVGVTRRYWDEAAKITQEGDTSSYQPPQSYDAPQPYDVPQPYDQGN